MSRTYCSSLNTLKYLEFLFPQYEEPEGGKDPTPSLPPVTVEPLESQRRFRIEWPNIVKLERPGSHQAVQVRTKPGGPDEPYTVIDVRPETSISEGITGPHVEMTSDAHETKGTFLYRAAREVVRTIEKETEQQALTDQTGHLVIQVAKLFGQTVKAAQQYHSSGYIVGPENQDRWPTDETSILKASQWLHPQPGHHQTGNRHHLAGSHPVGHQPLAAHRRAPRIRHWQQPETHLRADQEVRDQLRPL